MAVKKLTAAAFARYLLSGPLVSFNNENVDLKSNPVLSTIISPEDQSQQIFQATTNWFIKKAKAPTVKKWPGGWPSLTVTEFVNAILK